MTHVAEAHVTRAPVVRRISSTRRTNVMTPTRNHHPATVINAETVL